MKKFILTLVFLSSVAGAASGGSNPGGGSNIETAFKNYAINLAQELVLKGKGKDILKFDPTEVLAKARTFRPSCAVGVDLKLLQKKNKLAYVADVSSDTILLDCTGYEKGIPKTWNEFLGRRNTDARMLIVHELLRLLGKEPDEGVANAYEFSGSIAELDLVENKRIQSNLRELMKNDEPKNGCRLAFYLVSDWYRTDLGAYIYTYLDGNRLNDPLVIIVGKFIDSARAKKNNMPLFTPNEARAEILSLNPPAKFNPVFDSLNDLGCLE
jgi:hypothetical protein